MKIYQTIIIGAGQAGLVMGYYLKQLDQSFLIIDKSEAIGSSWKSRYDSLILFTPRQYSSLPGLKLAGNPHDYPTKDEIADYLITYRETFQLPVQTGIEVSRIWKENNHFLIETNKQIYEAENVVVATGPFQKPHIPAFTKNLSTDILQLHSSEYKNPANLRKGNVLVVGGGSSGGQIAVELSEERETYLSIGHKLQFLPNQIGNKSIFWWFDMLGITKAAPDSWLGRKVRAKGDPIFGYELKKAIEMGKVILKSRAISGEGTTVQFQDKSILHVQNIIWATGFQSDYSWINIKGILDQQGMPLQTKGETNIPGLYFLGLPWQTCRGSALLLGVGKDAQYIAELIDKRD
ncbi:putative flavoprotein involved in K+ transport [Bacillus thermophilus]|jgi:putative flavoprotein involved in K+ transport|uniref:Flavoprotein involved in K+ transport n=1 Tax=Siminovitchia thermophila TaxID=1245522 RepID=A0ABS2R3T8_9BACI|nr:putative flavoprotein involved in K+ transport [Siminovitchia thermophila]